MRNSGSFGDGTKETHRKESVCILLEGFTEENTHSKLITHKYYLMSKLHIFAMHLYSNSFMSVLEV